MRISKLIKFFIACTFFPVSLFGQTDSMLRTEEAEVKKAHMNFERAGTIIENSRIKNRRDSFLYKPLGWTNDFENLFSTEQVSFLDSVITEFEKRTSMEITIVTIDSSFVGTKSFDSLITSIGNSWGVGKAGKGNGIIIGMSSGARKIRISTGNGIEARLTDTVAKTIINKEILPQLRMNNYFEGIKKGLFAIINVLDK